MDTRLVIEGQLPVITRTDWTRTNDLRFHETFGALNLREVGAPSDQSCPVVRIEGLITELETLIRRCPTCPRCPTGK